MIKLPLETYKLFQIRLDALGISSQENPHYVKWVRYFLDFEAKYGASEPMPKMLDAFIAKLASKGQSAGLRDQARKAIHIYFEISQPATCSNRDKSSVKIRANPWLLSLNFKPLNYT